MPALRTSKPSGSPTICAPRHSTISDFRKNHPAPLKDILRGFNPICFQLCLFGKKLVADGTLIQAKLAKLIGAIDGTVMGRFKAAKSFLDSL